MEKLQPGEYLVHISAVGYRDHYLPKITLQKQPVDIGKVSMDLISRELKSVTVTAKRPLFEQKIDRMVVNVKSSITNAGSTVLEVLEKSPGVIVNRSSGAISLNGKKRSNGDDERQNKLYSPGWPGSHAGGNKCLHRRKDRIDYHSPRKV